MKRKPHTVEVPVVYGDGTEETRTITGYVVKLTIGSHEKRHRFLIHDSVHAEGKVRTLTHIASGHKVGELNSAGVSYSIATGRKLNERGQAQHLLDTLATKHGAETVVDKLTSAIKVRNCTQVASSEAQS